MLKRFKENPDLFFDEFFINCYVNPLISYINLYDKSYRKAAYMNGFSYLLKPFQYKMVPFRYVQHTDEFVENFKSAVSIEYRLFKDPTNFTNEIREELALGSYIIQYIDLYYWAPKIKLPQNIHFGHAMPVLDYDSASDSFHLYDIDKNLSYQYYKVSKEDLIDAYRHTCTFMNSNEESNFVPKDEIKLYDYAVIRLNSDLKSYQLSVEQLIQNTKRLIKELTAFKLVKSNPDKIAQAIIQTPALGTLSCTNQAHMQKGNLLLFEELKRSNIIDDYQFNILTEISRKLQEQIMSTLGKIIKNSLLKDWSNMNDILSSLNRLNIDELSLWKKLLAAIQ